MVSSHENLSIFYVMQLFNLRSKVIHLRFIEGKLKVMNNLLIESSILWVVECESRKEYKSC